MLVVAEVVVVEVVIMTLIKAQKGTKKIIIPSRTTPRNESRKEQQPHL